MPTYEYHCDSCDANFDVVQSFQDDPLTQCPTCGSPVRKVFGNVGIVFKGSGFYKTDSRKGGSTKVSEGVEPSAAPGGTDTSASGGETKATPAPKEAPSQPSTSPSAPAPDKPSKSTNGKPSDTNKAVSPK